MWRGYIRKKDESIFNYLSLTPSPPSLLTSFAPLCQMAKSANNLVWMSPELAGKTFPFVKSSLQIEKHPHARGEDLTNGDSISPNLFVSEPGSDIILILGLYPEYFRISSLAEEPETIFILRRGRVKSIFLAERVGFEPTVPISRNTHLAGECLQPCSAISPHE